jgi:hypothetical protein
MAIYKFGTFTTIATTTAQNLNLGFIPDVFRMKNLTLSVPAGVAGQVGGVADVYWDRVWGALTVPKTEIVTYTAGAPVYTSIDSGTLAATTGIIPFQTPDALLFVPNSFDNPLLTAVYQTNKSTNLFPITAITQAANASITVTHNFQTSDIGVTKVTFHGIVGMVQLNNLTGTITGVTGTASFTVDIDTTNFSAFIASGNPLANVITGAPTNTIYGQQSLPTAEANLGFIGLRLGTTIIGTVGNVWTYEAILTSPATGP